MRYIVKISYDGSNYYGFQTQKNKVTIQDTIEHALRQVFKKDVSLISSGRTDGGVSAIEQVCHIDLNEEINEGRCVGYLNSILPDDIKILKIERCADDFHARFSSKRKTYEYYFYVSQISIPVYDRIATKIGNDLDIEKMQVASKEFLGLHDFSAFEKSNSQIKNKERNIFNISIDMVSEKLYKLSITGNGFLHNMVRIIMGTLISVGMNKISIEQLHSIIDGKNRLLAGKTMPAKGLVLKKVEY